MIPGAPHDPDPAAVPAAAQEAAGAIGFEPGDGDVFGHVDLLQHLARYRIDPPQIAAFFLPRPVPEFTVDPGDAGDETPGFDRAADRTGFGVDLVDFSSAIFAQDWLPAK